MNRGLIRLDIELTWACAVRQALMQQSSMLSGMKTKKAPPCCKEEPGWIGSAFWEIYQKPNQGPMVTVRPSYLVSGEFVTS
jgi:hypothetical protein